MNRSSRRASVRERRDAYRKRTLLTHVLISVVALIECLILLSFTTYSWIETSSSLIISTGKGGLEASVSVARNMYYQVNITADAAGTVELVPDPDQEKENDGGYYRTVKDFNYARASSPDGENFYFKNGNASSTPYREGDTTDFNTSYTYMDFEIRNTSGRTKKFFLRNESALSVTGIDNTYKDVILGAMRISFDVIGDKDGSGNQIPPKILSIGGNTSRPVDSVNPAAYAQREQVSSEDFLNYVFDSEDPSQDNYLFLSETEGAADPNDVTTQVRVRVWFEESDTDFNNAFIANSEAVSRALSDAKITVNFALVSDNVVYGIVYFDDYAFSQRTDNAGGFATEDYEDDGYGVYFHIKGHDNTENNFPMTKSGSGEDGGVRWIGSVPVENYIQGNLETSAHANWNNSYFYYGAADGTMLYKWNLSTVTNGYFATYQVTEGNSTHYELDENTAYFRSLGVVRSASNYNDDSDGPILGFLQKDARTVSGDTVTRSDPMHLVYMRDYTTALTGGNYNAVNQTVPDNFQYVSAQAQATYTVTSQILDDGSSSSGGGSSSSSGGETITPSYAALVNELDARGSAEGMTQEKKETILDSISYFDVPSGWRISFASSVNSDYKTVYSEEGSIRATDGTVYYVVNYNGNNNEQPWAKDPNIGFNTPGKNNCIVLNSDLLPPLNSPDGWVRVYFYMPKVSSQPPYGKADGTDGTKWGETTRVKLFMNSYSNDEAHAWKDERDPNHIISIVSGPTSGQPFACGCITDTDTSYTVKGTSPTPTPDPTPSSEYETYTNYKTGLYLNLAADEADTQKTIRMQYDSATAHQYFMAYVPTSWSTGFYAHYNTLNGYYEVASDAIRWNAGAHLTDTYNLLGYTNNLTLNMLDTSGNIGTGVGTWNNVTEMKFDTELMTESILPTNIYKVGTADNQCYPMIPVAGTTNFTFRAYVDNASLSSQASNHALRFERYDTSNSYAKTGIWYPQDNITNRDKVFYPVDRRYLVSNGEYSYQNTASPSNSAASEWRGGFHVAVFVDSTFDQLVYQTLYTVSAVNGAVLEYSTTDSSSGFSDIVRASVTTNNNTTPVTTTVTPTQGANTVRLDKNRWLVPIPATATYVYFRWTPYPASSTTFNYSININNGIYCIVTETD